MGIITMWGGGEPSQRYTGLLRMKASCVVLGGLRKAGDIVQVNGLFLWTDDPYEPVIQIGTESINEAQVPVYGPTPSAVIFDAKTRS